MITFKDPQAQEDFIEKLNKARAERYERLNQLLSEQLLNPKPVFIYQPTGTKITIDKNTEEGKE